MRHVSPITFPTFWVKPHGIFPHPVAIRPRMTGRNSHHVGAGQITEAASGFPGYTGTIPKSAATMAKAVARRGGWGRHDGRIRPRWAMGS